MLINLQISLLCTWNQWWGTVLSTVWSPFTWTLRQPEEHYQYFTRCHKAQAGKYYLLLNLGQNFKFNITSSTHRKKIPQYCGHNWPQEVRNSAVQLIPKGGWLYLIFYWKGWVSSTLNKWLFFLWFSLKIWGFNLKALKARVLPSAGTFLCVPSSCWCPSPLALRWCFCSSSTEILINDTQ